MLNVQLSLLHTVLIIETTEASTGKTASLHVQGITMNNYQFYPFLHPYFPYYFTAPSNSSLLPAVVSLVVVVLLLITCVALLALALAVSAMKWKKVRAGQVHTDPPLYYNQHPGGGKETNDGIYYEVGAMQCHLGGMGPYQDLKLVTLERRHYEVMED